MNQALEKRKRVTMGGKARGEIRVEVGKVTGMVADVWGKRYRAFGRWGMAARKIEVLLVDSGLDVDRNTEA